MRNYLAIAAAAAVAISASVASVAPTNAMPMMPRVSDASAANVETVAYRGGHRGTRWIHRGHSNWRGGHANWRGGHHWRGPRYAHRYSRGHRHRGFYGPALGFGLGFGLGYGVGGYYNSYDPYYYGSSYYYPRHTYRTYVGGDWRAACARRYRSFDWSSGTYLGYDGLRHRCRL